MQKLRLLPLLVLLLWQSSHVGGQSCGINADSVVCLGNTFAASATVTGGTAQSYSWDLGDGGTSTLSSPAHLYANPGNYVVKVTIGLAGGGNCQCSLAIKVYNLPKAQFSLDAGSNYCADKNQVKLNDNSTQNPEKVKLKQRVVLWGDGAAAIDTGITNNSESHHYSGTGYFTIDMEISDANGCLTKHSQKIYISPPLFPGIAVTSQVDCDSTEMCFTDSMYASALFISRKWILDGQTRSDQSGQFCITYKQNSNHNLKLIIADTMGCSDTAELNYFTKVIDTKFDIKLGDTTLCPYQPIVGLKPKLAGMTGYQWLVMDTLGQNIKSFAGKGIVEDSFSLEKGFCGDGFRDVYLRISFTNCVKSYGPKRIEYLGPIGQFNIRNNTQCDTGKYPILFCDTICPDYSSRVKLFWDFDDNACPQCTTDAAKGINTNQNCRYSIGHKPSHLYKSKGCHIPYMYMTDTVTGCKDSTVGKQLTAWVGKTNLNNKGFHLLPDAFHQCQSNIVFSYEKIEPEAPCPAYVYINFDSACGKNNWVSMDSLITLNEIDTLGHLITHNYWNTCDTNGFVTVGFVAQTGLRELYTSCYTSKPVNETCGDTVWVRFRLKWPNADFSTKHLNICAPHTVVCWPTDTFQDDVVASTWYFYSDTIEVDSFNTSPAQLKSHSHIYITNGHKRLEHVVTDKWGCTNATQEDFFIGHYSRFNADTVVCLGTTANFYDTIAYFINFGQGNYWKISGRPENLIWDFGDGVTSTKSNPTHIYTKPGVFKVTLASVDSNGCNDSFSQLVHITTVHAAFRTAKAKYVCGEFVQFLDSSFIYYDSTTSAAGKTDKIVWWEWDFGDGKRGSSLQDPFHSYTSFGYFDVKLKVRNTQGCEDSMILTIFIKGPRPKASVVGDSTGCVPFTVKLANNSIDSTCSRYIWLMGDNPQTIITKDHPDTISFTYTKPGIYEIYLIGQDSVYTPTTGNKYFCTAVYPDTNVPGMPRLRVIVQPYLPAGFTTPDTVCFRQPFDLEDKSAIEFTDFNTYWGDGKSIIYQTKKIAHSYDSEGVYLIRHHPSYTPPFPLKLCADTAFRYIYVKGVKADFDIDTPTEIGSSLFSFRNKSNRALSYQWDFGQPKTGGDNQSILLNPMHDYGGDSGAFTVCLWAYSKEGCVDSICKPLHSAVFRLIKIPNVYTNDGDGINDAYDIEIIGEDYYDLWIYNRWGQMVFHGEADGHDNNGINWNGHNFNTGPENPTGTYYMVFSYRFKGTDEIVKVNMFVTLLRGK